MTHAIHVAYYSWTLSALITGQYYVHQPIKMTGQGEIESPSLVFHTIALNLSWATHYCHYQPPNNSIGWQTIVVLNALRTTLRLVPSINFPKTGYTLIFQFPLPWKLLSATLTAGYQIYTHIHTVTLINYLLLLHTSRVLHCRVAT